jgi:hypothetical protein
VFLNPLQYRLVSGINLSHKSDEPSFTGPFPEFPVASGIKKPNITGEHKTNPRGMLFRVGLAGPIPPNSIAR